MTIFPACLWDLNPSPSGGHAPRTLTSVLSPVSIQTQSLALRALRLDGNRAKRKRLRWKAANHGCHCFDRASYFGFSPQRHQGRPALGHPKVMNFCEWLRARDKMLLFVC